MRVDEVVVARMDFERIKRIDPTLVANLDDTILISGKPFEVAGYLRRSRKNKILLRRKDGRFAVTTLDTLRRASPFVWPASEPAGDVENAFFIPSAPALDASTGARAEWGGDW